MSKTETPQETVVLVLGWPRVIMGLIAVVVIMACGYFLGRGFYGAYLFNHGKKDVEARQYEAAKATLIRADFFRPQHPETLFYLARIARHLGDPDAALRHLRDAEKFGGVSQLIALERKLIALETQFPLSTDDAVAQLFLEAQQQHPDAREIAEVLAKGFFRTSRLPSVLDCTRMWLAMEPENTQAWVLQAKTYLLMRNKNASLVSYQKAAECSPDDDEIAQALGDLYLDRARPKEAHRVFENLLQKHPKHLEYSVGLARALVAMGQSDDAMLYLEDVLAREPRNYLALMLRGQIELNATRPDAAEPWLTKAAENSQNERVAIHTLIQCLRALGKTQSADQWAAQLKRIDEAHMQLGELTKRVQQNPADPDLRRQAGEIFLSFDNTKEGLRWLESALQVDPYHQATHRVLRDHYERVGQSAQANHHAAMINRPRPQR